MDYKELVEDLKDEQAATAITELLEEVEKLKAERDSARHNLATVQKMVQEYQDEIVPGYREKFGGRKPEGMAVEMADCIIRILDWCGKEGIDIDDVIAEKMAYNKTRPYRHGGKKL